MSRPASSGKLMNANELSGILSDSIRNIKNGTADIAEVTAISGAARTLCSVVKLQMDGFNFVKNNPEIAKDKSFALLS